MERCILTQAERIDKHAQTLARKSTTLSLHRERVNELLQQCHFELNQIFALESQVRLFFYQPIVSSNGSHAQLVQHRGRTDQNSGAGRTRKRALSLDSTILDGPGVCTGCSEPLTHPSHPISTRRRTSQRNGGASDAAAGNVHLIIQMCTFMLASAPVYVLV